MSNTTMQDFEHQFKQLTGHPPMPWQTRLYFEFFDQGELPSSVDIPTGLGKTAVTALWLIAIRAGKSVPRRLVYVVDRRAVVDQATEFVEKLRENEGLPDADSLAISTLRGQFADNREWLADPAKPAIIIGTVDMIGSRLLFQGYGVSRKMRPYHAGLLGVDSLIVLDESHLVPPFERLLESVQNKVADFGPRDSADRELIPGFHLLSLSATGRTCSGKHFQLEEQDIDADKPNTQLTRQRLNACKTLNTQPADQAKLPETLAQTAWKLSDQGNQPMRVLVYCNSREVAEKTLKVLGTLIKQREPVENVPEPPRLELFIGARRVHEREKAQGCLAEMGFLADSDAPANLLSFLIATSAGEVGVDLDADHMVCDLVPWERMVQRLGRVNRRGEGDARIHVLDCGAEALKSAPEPERMHQALHQLLDALPDRNDGKDVSPGELRRLKATVHPDTLQQASTPAPMYPPLNRALLDAWAMTSLREHTGRPEVAPWLRGWVDDEPQTSVVWRAILPTLEHESKQRRIKQIEDYFEAAPPHLLEQLTTESYRVAEWLLKRAKALHKQAEKNQQKEQPNQKMPHPNQLVAVTLNRAGEASNLFTLSLLATADKKRLERDLRDRTLVVLAQLGGLETAGALNAKINESPEWLADQDSDWPKDERDMDKPAIRWRVRLLGDEEESQQAWRQRLRWIWERDEEGEPKSGLTVYKWRDDAATEEDRSMSHPQSLAEHQDWAADRANTLGNRLNLPADYIDLLALTAQLHDEGKQAQRWQDAFNARQDGRPYAKTQGPVNTYLLGDYRHEFGSLFYAEKDLQFKALKHDQQKQDLVLHLIAAHHGYARPSIKPDGGDQATPSVSEEKARQVALRYVRLQRRWGPWGLAWWETLLRAADQQASKANDERKN